MSPFRGSTPFTETWKHFRVDRGDGVATVTLDRPEKLNALTIEALADLRDLLQELPHRGDTRALVIRGEGRSFCSGGDLTETLGACLSMSLEDLLDFTRMTGHVLKAFRECPVPIIAAVHGTAMGGGAVLALASDFRVVARSAAFGFVFTKIGLSGADMGTAYLLPRLVGLGRATKLLMLGETIDAAEADRYGLVSELVDDDQLDEAATALALRLASGPWFALAQTKALLTQEQDMSLSSSVELEAMTQALLMRSDDYAQFHAAYKAKSLRGRKAS
ncbi:enoyl-CoA hydratase family protein [Streptomyces nigra]|uniref:enoyl-CoA hydratase family protein n=1 Tax=Streptomyces nigra TaxID=1827580 RepID=UPI0037D114ED